MAAHHGFRPVVYVATNHDWTAYQHFYQGLATAFAASRPVLYVGSVLRGEKPFGYRLRNVAPNMWLLNVWVPKGAQRRALRFVSDRLLARAIRRALQELEWDRSSVLVWTYTTDAASFVKIYDPATSVYWTGDEVTDPFEPQLLDAVQHVLAVSPLAAEEKRQLVGGERVTQMPMATDPSPYIEAATRALVPSDLAPLPRPWFGYGGAVNARTDWELVRSLARATEGSVVIVGPPNDDAGRAEMNASDRPPNLVFLGHRDAATAPDYIAAFDVGLIPYRLTNFNLGSNPVKAYDYLAAGVPVVATDLPALAPLEPHVIRAADTRDFVDKALTAATESTDRLRQQRQEMARSYSYDALVRRIDDVLGPATRLP